MLNADDICPFFRWAEKAVDTTLLQSIISSKIRTCGNEWDFVLLNQKTDTVREGPASK